MKKMLRRIISLCICVCLIVTCFHGIECGKLDVKAAAKNYDIADLFTYNGTKGKNRKEPVDTVTLWDQPTLQIETNETGKDAEGASATLVPVVNGDIGFEFAPIPKIIKGGKNTYAFRKLTFRFRDLQDPENYFDYVVNNYNLYAGEDSNYETPVDSNMGMMAYVEYNGIAISTYRDWNDGEIWNINKGMTKGKNGVLVPPPGGKQIGAFVGKSRCSQQPQFKWDAEEKQILVINPDSSNGWNMTTVVADMDDPAYDFEKKFSGFEYYSVEIIFSDIEDGEKAGVMLSQISLPCYGPFPEGFYESDANKIWCAKDLSTNKDTQKPKVVPNQLGDLGIVVSGEKLAEEILACDFETGWIKASVTDKGTVLRYKKQGAEDSKMETLKDGKAPKVEEDGIYEIYASVKDMNGNVSEEELVGTFHALDPNQTYYDTDKLFTYQGTSGKNRQTAVNTAISNEGKKGLLIASEYSGEKANETGATFVPALTGNVEVTFSPIPKVVKGEKNDTYAYRKLIFRFRDLEDTSNYFDYVVCNYNKWGTPGNGYEVESDADDFSMAYVVYNGVAASTSREWSDHEYWMVNQGFEQKNGYSLPPYGGKQQGSFKGTEFSGRETAFRWDANEKQILVTNPDCQGAMTAVVADMDDTDYNFGKVFSGFDAYSIEVIFDEVQKGEKPGVLISKIDSVHGQLDFSVNRMAETDTKAPIVVEDQIGELEYADGKYRLPKSIKACDFESGYLDFAIGSDNLTMYYKKSGTDTKTKITKRDISTPEEEGSYEIYASVTDAGGNESEETLVGTFKGLDPRKNYYDTDSLFTYQGTKGTNRQKPENTPISDEIRKGLLIQSESKGAKANGTGATFVPALSGNFEISVSPVPVVKEGAANDTYGYRKLIFRFRDLLNPDNYFDYVVHNYNIWYSKENQFEVDGVMAYVEYNDVAISTSREWSDHEFFQVNRGFTMKDGYTLPPYGGSQVGSFKGTEWSNQEITFRWNSEEKQILVVNPESSNEMTTVVADMDDPSYEFGKKFSGFDAYSVQLIFDDVQDGVQPGILVSYTNSMWGELDFSENRTTVTDTNKPVVVANQIGKADYDGKQYVFPATIGACDFETGFISSMVGGEDLTLYYKKQNSDNKVFITTRMITAPSEEGTYEIWAATKDRNGNASEEVLIGTLSGLNPAKKYYDMDKLFRYHNSIGKKQQEPKHTPLTTDSAFVIKSTKSGSAANGTGATFIPSLSGDFTMDFSPIPIVKDGSNNDGLAYRTLTIRIRDQENTSNYFDYVITTKCYWGEKEQGYTVDDTVFGYVVYNGIPISTAREWTNQETWVINKGWSNRGDLTLPPYGGKQQGSFKGSEFSTQSMSFTWDSTKKQILVTNPESSFGKEQKVVVADMDDPAYGFEKAFSGFDYYSVEILFGDVLNRQTPAVAISRMETNYGEVDFSEKCYDREDTHTPQVVYNQLGRIDYVEGDFQLKRTVNAADFETGHIRLKPGNKNLQFYYVRKGTTEPKTYITDSTIKVPSRKGAYEMYAKIRDVNGNWSDEAYVGVFIYTGPIPHIYLDGQIPEYTSLGDSVTVPRGTYSFMDEYHPVWRITVTGPEGSKYNNTDITTSRIFTTDAVGTYTIVYTAIDNFKLDPDVANETKDPNYLSIQTTVLTQLSPKHLFSYYDPVTCQQAYSRPTLADTGTGLCFATDVSGSKVAFNATITGNTEISYSFIPGEEKERALSKFTIRFMDAEDENNYFDYVLIPASNDGSYTAAYVEYKGEKRSMDKDDANTVYKDDEVFCKEYGKYVGYQDAFFGWQWSVIDRVGWVKYDADTKEIRTRFDDKEYTIAAFDSRFGWSENFSGFAHGYNVMFLFDSIISGKTAQLNLHSINAIDLSGYQMNDPSGHLFQLEGNPYIIMEGGEDYHEAGWTAYYTLNGIENMVFNDPVLVDSELDTMRVGQYAIAYSTGVGKQLRYVTVQDTKGPELTLTGPADLKMFTGERYQELGVTVSDNVINKEAILVKRTGKVDTTKSGNYTIKYNGTDESGNTSSVIRKVEVVQDTEAPVLTLKGDAEVTFFKGEKIEDPGCSATDNANVEVTLTSDWDSVVKNKSGTYTVTYTGEDPSGNKGTITRTVKVLSRHSGFIVWGVLALILLVLLGVVTIFWYKNKNVKDEEHATE